MARTDNQVPTAKPLPAPAAAYDPQQMAVIKRTIEQNFEDVYAMITRVRDEYDSDAFLASCATHFLFMGSPGIKP